MKETGKFAFHRAEK